MSVLLQALKAILQGGPFQWAWITTGRAVVTRLLGVVLAALAVEFVADGVAEMRNASA